MLRIALLAAAIAIATPAAAHEPGVGPNGGMRVDAGPFRVELVASGKVVTVHVTMDDGSDLVAPPTTGAAILLVGGKPVRLPLASVAPGILSAEAAVELPADVKGAVQLVGSDGKTIQAKF